MANSRFGDVSVDVNDHVALVEIHRPPHNFFDDQLIRDLADAFETLDGDPACRASVLASEGKAFCAGADFNRGSESEDFLDGGPSRLYAEAVRLFACEKPVVAAIQGAAVGGGLGLALVADFRVVAPEARFAANFVKLGIHPGFGLTYTLPRLIGIQKAGMMLLTGRRITGAEAAAIGLADVLAPAESLREEALKLAAEIAVGAPLAVRSTRATLRRGLADAVRAQTTHELAEQSRLARTEDHKEGIRAVTERRAGHFRER
ncbi:MAG TPA: enoyl-CoA hydratase/isomerase family protein [Bryobacteraceae bacterium]